LRQALVALNLFFVALQSAAIQFEKKSQLKNVKIKKMEVYAEKVSQLQQQLE
jgi:hypothetical protein